MGRPLGQHFLRDSKVLDRTVQWIRTLYEQNNCQTLIEIGPWKGALTKKIVWISDHFFVFEKDTTLESHLLTLIQPAQIIWGDVLEQSVDTSVDRSTTLVVGNLPYYITSPILRQFFEQNRFVGGVFLIQKEVAEKIITDAPKKSYLWRLLNNCYDIHYCFTVKPKSFNPPPKVDSAVIALSRKEHHEVEDIKTLLELLELLSPYKRKTLGAIATLNTKKGDALIIPEAYQKLRLEEIGWEEMRNILERNKEVEGGIGRLKEE